MALTNLRILRLEASNIKRLSAVEITPAGELVVVGGRNGQGKTSVLDSILWALAGKSTIQWQPIRAGEAEGFIAIDLGNDEGLQLKVHRRFTAKEDGEYTTGLKIVTADGMRPQGEQTLLDTLVGALTFDPSEFIRAKPAEQVAILKGLVPGDFSAIARRRQEAFDARADFNREAKRIRATIESGPTLDENVKPIDEAPLIEAVRNVGNLASAWQDEFNRRANMREWAGQASRKADQWAERVKELEKELEEARGQEKRAREEATTLDADIANLEPQPPRPSSEEALAALNEAQANNRLVKALEDRRQLVKEAEAQEKMAAAQTAIIEAADKEAEALIEAADLPVRGLRFDENGVQLRGVPFNQASDAEQLRAALALAMAANPRLRVIRIRQGSLFDDEAMEVIRDVAGAEGFQIWVERVGDHDEDAIIIEDGHIRHG